MFDLKHTLPNNIRCGTGYHETKEGYILVNKGNKYIAEHRLIMERYLGRHLKSDEVIHHINRNRKDNRLCNLQLMTRKSHRALHSKEDFKCRKKYNIDEIKELYLQGLSTRAIGEKLNIGKSTVAAYMKELGISRPNMTKRDKTGKFKGRC